MTRAWIAIGLLLLPLVGCRDAEVCVRTVKATCLCDDPLIPDVKTCVAYAESPTCRGEAGVDPCEANPCCLAPVDGGRDGAGDAASVPDGGVEASVPDLSPGN